VSINLNGANGGNADLTNGNAGGGGGGSGGLLVIVADVIVLPTSGTIVTATGGSGGTGTANGGAGANGRIYLCYLRSISPSDAASRSNPAATVINLVALPVALA